ncbi:MAG: hypothetical protein CEN88_191 [Candidatus Berkelbacteria bacterium Licking1014_2]|uniref:Uncharacterized protein n=1 Tax=Candidatus Berkelbacteria bacterium Licking1014_2 TaxID=2017146 RepID=A0A554LW51_9BACT|nr:MAG: hypothetical protein CEN88_191 [Candidatus Berkelbacteria bacterium Licking1014_2]
MPRKKRIKEKKEPLIIWIPDNTIDYDIPPAEAIKDLPGSDPIILDIPMEIWNGGKSGIVKGVDIPLYIYPWPFSTNQGLGFLERTFGGCGVPAEIVPLKNHKEKLWDLGIRWIPALGDKKTLWQDKRGRTRIVYLDLGVDDFGFVLGFPDRPWRSTDALIGAPRLTHY